MQKPQAKVRTQSGEDRVIVERGGGMQGGASLFERILGAEHNLVLLDTADQDPLVAQLRLLARRTGQSVYVWRDEAGLRSLREGDVPVPGTKRMADALRYVLQSMHFGVYVFVEAVPHLRAPNTVLLRQIARARTTFDRRVVLMGAEIAMPDGFTEEVARLRYDTAAATRLRLRDGRWVV